MVYYRSVGNPESSMRVRFRIFVVTPRPAAHSTAAHSYAKEA